MKDIHKIIRPHILSLQPYASARDEYTGKAGVFLDANENPFSAATGQAFHRYPDPYQRVLKEKLAEVKGVRSEQIFLGNGSDEAIDLLFRISCEPATDTAVILPPTYGMYKVSANIQGVRLVEIPLTPDFQLPVAEIKAQAGPQTKLLFICSPNNPTANLMAAEDILEILEVFPGLVVIDEAYIDFAEGGSWLEWLDRYPRLVVLQTFSKAWGMAALRLGAAYAHPEIIRILNKVKPPYNINILTQELALEALDSTAAKDQMVADILLQRQRLRHEMEQFPFVSDIYPSEANFLLIKVADADAAYQYLMEQLVIVRNRSRVTRCEGCLRITVGTPEENTQLLTTMAEYGKSIRKHELGITNK